MTIDLEVLASWVVPVVRGAIIYWGQAVRRDLALHAMEEVFHIWCQLKLGHL